MAFRGKIIFVALLLSLVATCYGEEGLFSDLKKTLSISATPTGKVNLKAGEDKITMTWGLDPKHANLNTATYKNVEVKLCYLPESQVDRPWRRHEDELARDKTCQFSIVKQEFKRSNNTFTYTVKRDVPTAHYFIRVYVRDGPEGKLIAYGDTTGLDIKITGISGRTLSIDVAASVFSGFSVLSLAFFYFLEKRKARKSS